MNDAQQGQGFSRPNFFSGDVSEAENPKAVRLRVEGISKETEAIDGEMAQMNREADRAPPAA